MKLAISNIAWKPEENDRILPVLKQYGVTGIEVAPPLLFQDPANPPIDSIRSVRDYWKDNGLEIVAMQSLLFGHPEMMVFGDESVRRRTLSYLKKIIRVASKLGVRAIVFGSPRNRQVGAMERGYANEIAREFFYELATEAYEFGMSFCIEPNATGYNCDFVTDTTEAVNLVSKVDHPGFGMNLDAGVITMNNESWSEALTLAGPYIRHFHISEPFLKKIVDDKSGHELIGNELRRHGYDGWVSIEMQSGLGADNVEVVRECLKFATTYYR